MKRLTGVSLIVLLLGILAYAGNGQQKTVSEFKADKVLAQAVGFSGVVEPTDLYTSHYLTDGEKKWELWLDQDLGGDGPFAFSVNGLKPGTTYRVWVVRAAVINQKPVTASDTLTITTLKQYRFGQEIGGDIIVPPKNTVSILIKKSAADSFKSVVFWPWAADSCSFQLTMSSDQWNFYKLWSSDTTVYSWNHRIVVEIPIDWPEGPFSRPLPDSFYLHFTNIGRSNLFLATTDSGGLDATVDYGYGPQDAGKIMLAFGYTGGITAVNRLDRPGQPAEFVLQQNYPNPFNPETTIPFALPAPGKVQLVIYDLLGQEVRTLVSGDYSAGNHSIAWDTTDQNSVPVSSGVYFYRLEVNDQVMVKKMTLMR